jgi:hypothetical protein
MVSMKSSMMTAHTSMWFFRFSPPRGSGKERTSGPPPEPFAALILLSVHDLVGILEKVQDAPFRPRSPCAFPQEKRWGSCSFARYEGRVASSIGTIIALPSRAS